MDNNYYVYRHICPDGKVYVGVTTNPKRRWEAHGSNYFDHPIFCAAIKNFGWDNIKHIIAFSCADKDKARRKEKKLAEYYQYYGLSLNAGNGHSHSPSAQNRQKVAEARRKAVMSEETRRKIAKAIKRRVGTKYLKHRLQAMEE